MIRIHPEVSERVGNLVRLSAEDHHYLFRVMRAAPGDRIEIQWSDLGLFEATVGDDETIHLRERLAQVAPPPLEITLYQSLLKGDRFSEVVEKGTEVGIARFVPIVAERGIVRVASESKLRRWHTIAKEASEQCHGGRVPEIGPLVPLGKLGAPLNHSLSLVLDPHGTNTREILPYIETAQKVDLVVGPEGGLKVQEVERLTALGYRPWSMGPRIFRAENAGVFAALLLLDQASL